MEKIYLLVKSKKTNMIIAFIALFVIGCNEKKQERFIIEQPVPTQSFVICPQCAGYGQVASYYGPVNCPLCQGAGQIVAPGGSNPSFGARTTSLVQTNASCDECGCSGYRGIKHDAGTYEGDCSHSDGYGHTCRHSPTHHGLRQY